MQPTVTTPVTVLPNAVAGGACISRTGGVYSGNLLLQRAMNNDNVWTADSIGYNFLHVIDITTHPAFTVAQAIYLVEYKITPTSGQPIIVRFQISVI